MALVRAFRAEDAEGIMELFRAVYGENYLDEVVYNPDQLTEKNCSGEMISVVALDGSGSLIGHVAAVRRDLRAGAFELAQGVVVPSSRGRSVFTELLDQVLRIASASSDCRVLYAEPVTNHVFTQVALTRSGFRDTGILYNMVPAEMMIKELRCPRPVSVMMQFHACEDRAQKQVYLPSRYRALAAKIFDSLSLSRTVMSEIVCDGTSSHKQRADVTVEQLQRYGIIKLNIFSDGKTLGSQICEIEFKALRDNRRVIYSYIDMSAPAALRIADLLRRRGFVFCSILPNWWNNDVLVLQKLMNGQTPYPARINSEMGQLIARCIDDELRDQSVVRTSFLANRSDEIGSASLDRNDWVGVAPASKKLSHA